LDKVTKSINEDECVDVIYLDFAKAFDKVPPWKTNGKLSKHGIDGKVWDWIRVIKKQKPVCACEWTAI